MFGKISYEIQEPVDSFMINSRSLIRIILTASVLVVYAPALGHTLLGWDDNVNIYDNPYFYPLSLENTLRFWEEPYRKLYAPMTYTLWSLVAGFSQIISQGSGKFTPWVFHGLNILIHM